MLDPETENEYFFHIEPPSGGPAWMLSFADLLSVLLTFFVMLYSTTAIQNNKWEAFINSFQQRFQLPPRAAEVEAMLPVSKALPAEEMGANLDYLRSVINEKIASYPQLKKGEVIRTRNRLLLSFPVDAFFKNGLLTEDAKPTLESLVAVFNLINNRVDVAYALPPGELKSDPAAWEQSITRASRVAGALMSGGYHFQLNAYAYLNTLENPADDANGSGGQTDAPPRIDFVIRDVAGVNSAQN
jgi:chemotaxis protein MotB